MEPLKASAYIYILSSLFVVATTAAAVNLPIKQVTDFLNTHNIARKKAGVPPLIWDPKLADYAYNWASKQAAACQMVHSNGRYGENIWWGGAGYPWTPIHAVTGWVDEEKYYDRTKNDCTCLPGHECLHYTQVVWRDTTKLGCVEIKCNNGNSYSVCEYDPPGNFVGYSPFEKHDPSLYIDFTIGK